LKQVVAQIISSQKSALPVWLEVLSGNSSDKASFADSVVAYCKQLSEAPKPYFMMDSTGFSADGAQPKRQTYGHIHHTLGLSGI
jgi:transposase